MEVKRDPSSLPVNITLNAYIVDSRTGGIGVLKSSRIKTNSSFTLVQKRHLAFLFSFYKQACHTKGEMKVCGGQVRGIFSIIR